MKLKVALKKFSFLKKLDLTDDVTMRACNILIRCLKGEEEIYMTPFAEKCDPFETIYEWDQVFKTNKHLMNPVLIQLEEDNRKKIGPRSQSISWHERKPSVAAYYSSQDDNHSPRFKHIFGEGNLCPASLDATSDRMKSRTSAGYPFLCHKEKAKPGLLADFDKYYNRNDPAVLFTRTAENRKTRNVWGFPFADTFYEMFYYAPLLAAMRLKPYRAALVSPDAVAKEMTRLIRLARATGRLLFTVDFAGFDASVKYQYIIEAFNEIKSHFTPNAHAAIDDICRRIYTIGIVTPDRIMNGKHGIPSGSTFTNECDSIIQRGIAMYCDFIKVCEMLIQGDDGVYVVAKENIDKLVETFKYAGLRINKEKSYISSDYAIFCQNLYHIDYEQDGIIGAIYPTYRALNRLMFLERFTDFKKMGLQGKDYFGIRALTILENCKNHPLFEDLVRFIVQREKYSLNITEEGLQAYCSDITEDIDGVENLNHQYGSNVRGIKAFKSYILVQQILAEEKDSTMEIE